MDELLIRMDTNALKCTFLNTLSVQNVTFVPYQADYAYYNPMVQSKELQIELFYIKSFIPHHTQHELK